MPPIHVWIRLREALAAFEALNPEIEKDLTLHDMRFNEADGSYQAAQGHCANVAFQLNDFLQQQGFDVVKEHEDRHPSNRVLAEWGIERTDDDPQWQYLLDGHKDEWEVDGPDLHWADIYGISDRPLEGSSTDITHEVTVVDLQGVQVMIDYTAAQYGIRSFPLVQVFDRAHACWQRIDVHAPSHAREASALDR